MNDTRRKTIRGIIDKLEELRTLTVEISDMISEVRDEEEEYRDNIPENMQCGERYERADSAVDALESAVYAIEDFDIDQIESYLEDSME